jgi:tetratricopeptide (TPR) repeat protein
MPTVFNGIGTWYTGKSNIHNRMGACEFCHSYGELKSYDTTLYFVVLFVPLIPLGRKRVLNECPVCHKHLVLELKKWKEQRDRELTEKVQALRQDARNFEKARDAVQAMVAYQDRKMFLLLADGLKHNLGNHAEMQAVLGSAYAFFNLPRESEECLRRSIELKDDPEIREMLAVNLVKQLRPENARPFIQHILDQKNEEKVAFILILAEGYQARGMHEEALATLDEGCRVFPVLANNTEWKNLHKTSEKYRGRNKPIKSALFNQVKTASEGTTWMSRLPAFIGPAIVVGLLATWMLVSYSMGQKRSVYLLNGLERPYGVMVNGQKAKLFPRKPWPFPVAEGTIRIQAQDPELPSAEQTCTVETPFWLRPFLNRTFVINPDRAAVLIWEETVYAPTDSHDPGKASPYKLYAGDLLYTFKGVDYSFEDFPKSIRLDSQSSRAHRNRVDVLQPFPSTVVYQLLTKNRGAAIANAYLRNLVLGNPDDEVPLFMLTNQMSAEEGTRFLRPKLEVQPIRLNWHRAYQTLMERSQPGHDLTGEYRALLEKDPSNSALLYLLGRVTTDPNTAEQLFLKATEGDKPCPYAFYALAYRRASRAEFAEAFSLARQAAREMPASLFFANLEEEMLQALGRYDELIERVGKERQKNPLDVSLVGEEIRLRAAKGEKDQARQIVDAYCKALQKTEPAERAEEFRKYLTALRCYSEGDLKGYLESMGQMKGEKTNFDVALSAGKLTEAAQILKDSKEAGAYMNALLYAASASNPSMKDFSEEHLQATIKGLREGGKEERFAADCLEGKCAADPARIRSLELHPAQKRILMAAMGARFPAQRAACFETGRQLNYNTAFPHLFLKDLFGKP